MSETLDRLERAAYTTNITDPADIDGIMLRFLDLRYEMLNSTCPRYRRLVDVLSEGFDLFEEDIVSLTLRDLLLLIGSETEMRYFGTKREDWYVKAGLNNRFNTAPDCFMLADILLNSERKNLIVKQFLHINLFSLLNYADVFEDIRSGSFTMQTEKWGVLTQRDIRESCQDLLEIYRRYNLLNLSHSFKELTLKDYLKLANALGVSGWICGGATLEGYVKRSIAAYSMTRVLFMDVILRKLIDRGLCFDGKEDL